MDRRDDLAVGAVHPVDLDGSAPKVVLDSSHRYAAPEWTPDGAGPIVNGGGRLWRLPASGGTPSPIPTGPAGSSSGRAADTPGRHPPTRDRFAVRPGMPVTSDRPWLR